MHGRRVLLDLRMVSSPLRGTGRYALELARRLPKIAPEWQFSGLVGPKFSSQWLGELAPAIPLVETHGTYLGAFEQPLLAATLRSVRPDLFHATSFSVPALWSGPLVVTVHDVAQVALTELSTIARTAYYRLIVAPRAKAARALITVSQFSRREICEHLGFRAEQWRVIANGVDEIFRPAQQSELDDFRARRGLPPRYFAVVGSVHAHKNLAVLQSIAQGLPAPLVLLAGRAARQKLGFGNKVLELSPLPDREMARLYAGAVAVLIPSRYEGSGLAALEAFGCGAPVIACNAGALPEVVRNVGILVSADNSFAWAEAIRKVASEPDTREQMRAAGLALVPKYSWDSCAMRTLNIYRRALSD